MVVFTFVPIGFGKTSFVLVSFVCGERGDAIDVLVVLFLTFPGAFLIWVFGNGWSVSVTICCVLMILLFFCMEVDAMFTNGGKSECEF